MSAFEEFSHRTAMSESGPDASTAEAGTAVVRVPAAFERAVGEGRLSYRSCSSRVFSQQPADRPMKEWRIHTPPNGFVGMTRSCVQVTKSIEIATFALRSQSGTSSLGNLPPILASVVRVRQVSARNIAVQRLEVETWRQLVLALPSAQSRLR